VKIIATSDINARVSVKGKEQPETLALPEPGLGEKTVGFVFNGS